MNEVVWLYCRPGVLKTIAAAVLCGVELRGPIVTFHQRLTTLSQNRRQLLRALSDHRNKVNRAIHLACIWPILWTTLALMTQLPIGKLPHEMLRWLPLRQEAWDLHLGAPVGLIYVIIYCVMDPFVGGLASLLVIASYVTSNLWMADGGSSTLAGGVNVAGWLAQLYGHFVHEGKSPALVDNLFQALLAAPLFVLCEVFFELGYKPEMHRRIQVRAGLNSGGFRLPTPPKNRLRGTKSGAGAGRALAR